MKHRQRTKKYAKPVPWMLKVRPWAGSIRPTFGSLLGTQHLRLCPSLWNQNVHLNRVPEWSAAHVSQDTIIQTWKKQDKSWSGPGKRHVLFITQGCWAFWEFHSKRRHKYKHCLDLEGFAVFSPLRASLNSKAKGYFQVLPWTDTGSNVSQVVS